MNLKKKTSFYEEKNRENEVTRQEGYCLVMLEAPGHQMNHDEAMGNESSTTQDSQCITLFHVSLSLTGCPLLSSLAAAKIWHFLMKKFLVLFKRLFRIIPIQSKLKRERESGRRQNLSRQLT